MVNALNELVELLRVEQLEDKLFRGISADIGNARVFGGQVLGQALMAAASTVDPSRSVHSLHAYFLRPGDKSARIVYDVDCIRDGGSFTTRRVVAIQHGKAIFNFAASFHQREVGLEHQVERPDLPGPDGLASQHQIWARVRDRLPERLRARLDIEPAIEIRPLLDHDPLTPGPLPPQFDSWMRAVGQLPDDPVLHQAMLAYASDFGLLRPALQPHGRSFFEPDMQVASLDHAMWFHRDFRFDEWLLYRTESPFAGGGRGFSRGSIFSRDGQLIASAAQEGLIRSKALASSGYPAGGSAD
ncbi:acyl-CoA thioesterase [Piscinibacter sakaiensis]|uniref:acyl-CoA thioesterase n=1 Tax=Piscinibacter sakaiensis TaxID=1547922 RepID=UPI003AAAFCF2